MRFIYSSGVDDIHAEIPDNFVGVYIPVTHAVVEEHGIKLTCNGQRCIECGKCYGKKDPGVIYAKFKPYTVPA